MRKEDVINELKYMAELGKTHSEDQIRAVFNLQDHVEFLLAAATMIRMKFPCENEDYPQNLLLEIGILMPEDEANANIEGLELALSTLSKREQEILRHRYKEKLSHEETGKLYGVTRERIRQIEARALRKMRHASRTELIIIGKDAQLKYKEKQEEFARVNRELDNEIQKIKNDIKKAKETGEYDETRRESVYDIKIEDMGLTVRPYNCLYHAHIKNLGDLSKMSVGDLMRVRNMGPKSLSEVIEKMKKYGVDPREVND